MKKAWEDYEILYIPSYSSLYSRWENSSEVVQLITFLFNKTPMPEEFRKIVLPFCNKEEVGFLKKMIETQFPEYVETLNTMLLLL